MKKSLIVQTVITGILILLIAAFGIYALFIANQSRTSININVADENLEFELSGFAGWGNDSFNTQTGPNGLINKVQNLDDLQLTKENLSKPEQLTLNINNKNRHPEYSIKITISGLAYDDYQDAEARFLTYVTCICDDEESVVNKRIDNESPNFEVVIEGSVQNIEIVVSYYLLKANSTFDLAQDIILTFDSEDSI